MTGAPANPAAKPAAREAPDERRRRLVRELFLLFLEQQNIEHHWAGEILHIKLPVEPHTGRTRDWAVAFEKTIADEHYVDCINYTSVPFQKILSNITEGGPLLCYRLALTPGVDGDLGDAWRRNVIRTDFSYHITYSTYGRTWEELWQVSIGPADLGQSIVTDLFQDKPFQLPTDVGDHYDLAQDLLEDHLAKRVDRFCKEAAKSMNGERKRMQNSKDEVRRYSSHGYKQINEDSDFYRRVIERFEQQLEDKYRVSVKAELLTVEPYFAPVGDEP